MADKESQRFFQDDFFQTEIGQNLENRLRTHIQRMDNMFYAYINGVSQQDIHEIQCNTVFMKTSQKIKWIFYLGNGKKD